MAKRRRPRIVFHEIDWSQCDVQLSAEGFAEIAKRITAERKAWRKALGVPQGFLIPEKPLPETEEECSAELAVVKMKQMEAYRACLGMPPGPEYESRALHMVLLRDRRVKLQCALKELGSRIRKRRNRP